LGYRDNQHNLRDYYGKLLTEKQQEYFEDYYHENLTMDEISENDSVSKNAVSKQLIIIKDKLNYYENILKLNQNKESIKKILSEEDYSNISKYI
jgi:predicted DNA-binding protein YlxM (UPF0122 family)